MSDIWRPLSSVKVGEKLQYGYRGFGGAYLPAAVVSVAKVGRNFLIDDKGNKWKFSDSRRWGNNYGSERIDFFTAEEESEWADIRERKSLLGRVDLDRIRWREMELAKLRAIVEILEPAK